MIRIDLSSETDWEGWRDAARRLCAAHVRPDEIDWHVPGGQGGLDFGSETGAEVRLRRHGMRDRADDRRVTVPKSFVDRAKRVICHRDPERFARLYTLLWRLQKQSSLLQQTADRDVVWLNECDKAIRRDVHKMHAFVRFRKAGERGDGREQFAAWFEPTHRIAGLGAPFFQKRFSNMDWVIVTPEATVRWDGVKLEFGAGGSRRDVPAEDAIEDQWRTYFASIFNPARLKVKAMTAEMPKKYWKNLPEAELIPALISSADARSRDMQAHAVSTPSPLAAVLSERKTAPAPGLTKLETLSELRAAAETCTRCPLACQASQTVFGEGPDQARLMIVGEQPGDQEDIKGRPFVGPAGEVLNRCLAAANLDRSRAYVTNAVKHFKFEVRGKRRIHSKPNTSEIDHCRWWLDNERALVKPDLIVTLGVTALRGVTGESLKLADVRARPITLSDGVILFSTIHPSFLLRLPDPRRCKDEEDAFIADLSAAAALLAAA
ncbi:MAG: UdgX family uracil-DNA binding protein [Pseudomonadota bacterium]